MAAGSLGTWLRGELLRAKLLDLSAPRVQDRYVVQAVLGQGASGLVVLAFDERLHREVALKLAPCGRNEEAMLNEGRALAKLRRPPFVVQILEAGAANLRTASDARDVVFLLMERAVGVTLREWIIDARARPSDCLRVLARVALGLDYVHQHGIIHGDVKPENVVVAPDDEPLLVDFGFAAPIRRHTSPGAAVVGTAPYLSPEARRGRPRRKSDVYALSVMCWELLTGVHPFGEWREPKLKWYGALETLPFEETIPEPLRSLLRYGMHPWAALRPSAQEIADGLAAAAETFDLHAAKPIGGSSRCWWVGVLLIGACAYGIRAKPMVFERMLLSGTYSITLGEGTEHLACTSPSHLRIMPRIGWEEGKPTFRSEARLDCANAEEWEGEVVLRRGERHRVRIVMHRSEVSESLCLYLEDSMFLRASEGEIFVGSERSTTRRSISMERTF